MRLIKNNLVNFIKHLQRQYLAWRSDLWFVGLSFVLAFAFILPNLVKTIPSGNVGVEWRRFQNGTQIGNPLSEGIAFIMPWNQIFLYDTRAQIGEASIHTLSADGLSVDVEMTWTYNLVPEAAGIVHKTIGPDYGEKIIGRVVTAMVRNQIAAYRSEDLHSSERINFEKSVDLKSAEALSELAALQHIPEFLNLPNKNWVILEKVLIKEVRFPQAVQDAYVRKNTARALVEEYNYRNVSEQKEVERKRTEALGIRGFQEIVNNGLSDSYLKWRGIEATLALSQSNNAKVVVIGAGNSGLPLILNTGNEEIKNGKPQK